MLEEEEGKGGVEGDVHNNVQPELKRSYLIERWNPNDIFPMRMGYEDGPVDATGEDEEAVQNPESQPHKRRAFPQKVARHITVGFRDPLRSFRKTSSKYCLCRCASYERVIRCPADKGASMSLEEVDQAPRGKDYVCVWVVVGGGVGG